MSRFGTYCGGCGRFHHGAGFPDTPPGHCPSGWEHESIAGPKRDHAARFRLGMLALSRFMGLVAMEARATKAWEDECDGRRYIKLRNGGLHRQYRLIEMGEAVDAGRIVLAWPEGRSEHDEAD